MKIAYASGTRADFGLMTSALRQIEEAPELTVGIMATGTHLDTEFGHTIDDITASGLDVVARIEVPTSPRTGLTVAHATAEQVRGFADALSDWKADCLLVLGDRPEMLAAAIAAGLLDVPIWHIHGGERSGSIDESIRHAISKLAHMHCTATDAARERLVRMGENPANIHVIGAPGLDALNLSTLPDRDATLNIFDVPRDVPLCIAVFHPVTHEQGRLAGQMETVITGILDSGVTAVLFRPNSDAGGDEIGAVIDKWASHERLKVRVHAGRTHYLGLLNHADIMVGNSSSGIIEAASFGLPVIDIGSRQNLRERGDNVTWVEPERDAIRNAIERALESPRPDAGNIYGDGQAGARLKALLCAFQPDRQLLAKYNAY